MLVPLATYLDEHRRNGFHQDHSRIMPLFLVIDFMHYLLRRVIEVDISPCTIERN